MSFDNASHYIRRRPSRRRLLLLATALVPAAAIWALAQSSRPASGPLLAYVGTYSSPQGPEGRPGHGQGIYLFQVDRANGSLTQRELTPNPSNPACLALDRTKTHLYSANETNTYEGASSGSVSAYSIDRATGHLTLLDTVSSEGMGPAHMSIHPSGRYVLVANYAGGTVAVLPIRPDGSLGPASDVKQDQGDPIRTHSATAPPGSFAFSGHDRPHAHMILADPSGKFVLAADLGLDRIFIWKFDVEKGQLAPNDPPYVSLPPGDGPRHFAFHPNSRWMYSLQEEASTLVKFDWNIAGSGAGAATLAPRQTISSLPPGFKGTDYTSEIMLSSNGKYLYAADRLHDGIALFSVGASGDLTYVAEEWTRGDYPRSFNMDPTGRFFYSCNQQGDAITTYRVDPRTGRLAFTGQYTAVGTPANIVFLD